METDKKQDKSSVGSTIAAIVMCIVGLPAMLVVYMAALFLIAALLDGCGVGGGGGDDDYQGYPDEEWHPLR